jgi:hypothetical protein
MKHRKGKDRDRFSVNEEVVGVVEKLFSDIDSVVDL